MGGYTCCVIASGGLRVRGWEEYGMLYVGDVSGRERQLTLMFFVIVAVSEHQHSDKV